MWETTILDNLTITENDVKQTKILDEKVMCTCMKVGNKYINKMGEESVKKSSFLNTHGTNSRCMDNRIHLLCQIWELDRTYWELVWGNPKIIYN